MKAGFQWDWGPRGDKGQRAEPGFRGRPAEPGGLLPGNRISRHLPTPTLSCGPASLPTSFPLWVLEKQQEGRSKRPASNRIPPPASVSP